MDEAACEGVGQLHAAVFAGEYISTMVVAIFGVFDLQHEKDDQDNAILAVIVTFILLQHVPLSWNRLNRPCHPEIHACFSIDTLFDGRELIKKMVSPTNDDFL